MPSERLISLGCRLESIVAYTQNLVFVATLLEKIRI